MLLTNYQELDALYPNHRFSEHDFSALIPYIEEEEESTLLPILGDALFEQIVTDYQHAIAEVGTLYTEAVPTLQTRILRLCQRAVFYKMLANNSGIFAVSFNLGGGLNTLSADNYDEADDKTKRTFERDVWAKAKRHIESLLMYLEKDAREKSPLYLTLWKQSNYFYYHADLLFTTAQEMKPYYPINDRSEYISLIPTIRIIQTNYIAPAIGDHILQALIDHKYGTPLPQGTTLPQGTSLPQGGAEAPSPSTPSPEDSASSPSPSPEVSPEGGAEAPSPSPSPLWSKLRTQVLTATAQFLRSRIAPQTPHVLQDADLALSLCTKIVKENPEVFPKEAVHGTPPQKPSLASPPNTCHHHHHHQPTYNIDDPDNAILDFGFVGHNT